MKPVSSIPGLVERLGLAPDSEIAFEFNVSSGAVKKTRAKLGISSFCGLLLTQEGYPCRSLLEAKYDAWLHHTGIEHLHQTKVPGSRFIADYLIDGVYHEVTGMIGYDKYDIALAKKKSAYTTLAVPVVYITADTVDWFFADCPVKIRLDPKRECRKCGTKLYDIPNGMCRRCNRIEWGKINATEHSCAQCGKSFMRDAGSFSKRCSRSCYYDSLKKDMPSAQELIEIWDTRSINGLANEIGVRPGSLYQRIYRFQKKDIA